MKKDDESLKSANSNDFSDLDFDIDEFLESINSKYTNPDDADEHYDEIKEEINKDLEEQKDNKQTKTEKKTEDDNENIDQLDEKVIDNTENNSSVPQSRTERSQKNNQKAEKENVILAFCQKYKIFKIISYIILCLALIITAYGGYLFYRANHLMDTAYVARKKSSSYQVTMTEKPISILLMGIDNTKERNLESTRTDSLIFCTFNPKTGKVDMVSIPRDTYTEIYNKEDDTCTTGKINSAYSIAGVDGTINAVESLLDIPVDYYVQVDFNALESVVNAFGGIYVDVPFTLTEQDAHGKKRIEPKEGDHQKLNGEQALAFARTRHIDNDIERGARQQEVIEGIVNQALNVGSMTKYAKVLKSLNGHVQTDMPKDVIMGLAKSSTKHKVDITHYKFKWASFNYNGESFVALNKENLQYIRHKLKLQLGNEEPDERDQEGYQEPETSIMDPSTYPIYGVTWDN